MNNYSAIFLATLLTASCAVGPDYRAPQVAPAVVQNAQSTLFVTQSPEALWWQEFADPELDALERRALAANLDLRSAYDRVRAARAVFSERKLDYAPHVQLDGSYSHFDEQQPGFGPARINAQSDSLGFDAAWEVDLFGHVRRSVEAARGDLGAEQANYQDAQVTVAAEVARNYFELRGAQKRLLVARENLGTDTFEGLDVQRSRETFTFYKQSIGNTNTILRIVDYWYSPALGINVKVVRHDPRDGDQTLWLTDISQSAGDPQSFKVPEGYRIIDHRTDTAQPTESQR